MVFHTVKCLTGQNRTKTGHGREGQVKMRAGEAAFLGFSFSDILVDRTRVLALPICPISHLTFVWINLFYLNKKNKTDRVR